MSEWLTESLEPITVLVSNGHHPVLRIQVHKYSPQDKSLLDHILWRGDAKSSFKRFPSTPFGIREEASVMADLDHYMDQHIPILLEELSKSTQDLIYVKTMRVAYQFYRNNREKVSRAPWLSDVL